MKKKSNVVLKAIDKEPAKLINIRMSKTDKDILVEKAEMYTRGNLSALIKYAVRNFSPKASELKTVC